MKSVTGREFCQTLQRKGWSLIRTRGGHQVWANDGFPNVSIPVHAGRALKLGLQAALMKQAGLTDSDL